MVVCIHCTVHQIVRTYLSSSCKINNHLLSPYGESELTRVSCLRVHGLKMVVIFDQSCWFSSSILLLTLWREHFWEKNVPTGAEAERGVGMELSMKTKNQLGFQTLQLENS